MAHTVLESPRVTTAFQGDRLSSIVGADHELIRLSTGVFSMAFLASVTWDLFTKKPESQKRFIWSFVQYRQPWPSLLKLILMALLTHEQIDEITHCGTGPNVKSRSLHR